MNEPIVTVTPRWSARAMAAAIVVLAAGHAFAIYLYRGLGLDRLPGSEPVARLLNMDGETNVPGWYATMLLFTCAVLCALIWRATAGGPGTYRRHWAGLALILVFLSVDEGALIHEEFSRPLTNRLDLDADAWRYWAWVVPYTAFAAVVAVVYARFLWRLPSRIRNLIVVAGVVFVAGAAGMELVGRELFDPADVDATYLAAVGVEEVLEKIGVSVLLYALVSYLRDHVGPVRLAFSSTGHDTRPEDGRPDPALAGSDLPPS